MAANLPLAEAATAALRSQAAGLHSVKAADFFREVCKCLPWVVQNYKLEEMTTVPKLRRVVADMIRKNSKVSTPDVINLLVYQGREELEMVCLQHKQRHHLIAKYVVPFDHPTAIQTPAGSKFLQQFYSGNTNYSSYGFSGH